MLHEAIEYLRDVASYRRVFATRRALRRPGQGVDFGDETEQRAGWEAVNGLHPHQMGLRVVEVIDETPSTRTLRCQRMDGPLPPFRPGQYLSVLTEVEGVRTNRPYSISSVPGAGHLDLTIKVVPDGFVAPHLARHVGQGDELVTTGTAGTFVHEPLIHGRDLVFIAGGSGITPFMSMIRTIHQERSAPRVHLIYGSRKEDDVIFRNELDSLAAAHEWFSLSLVISEPSPRWQGLTGWIDRALLDRVVGEVEGRMFYLCGPSELYALAEPALRTLGVEQHRITRELFGAPRDVTQEPGWPTEVEGDELFQVDIEGKGSVSAQAGESLLTALERHDVDVPTVCRTGACSACRVRITDGASFALAQAGIREADRQAGFTHACVTYPLSDMGLRI
jgi:ferredoxin-NADP reductase